MFYSSAVLMSVLLLLLSLLLLSLLLLLLLSRLTLMAKLCTVLPQLLFHLACCAGLLYLRTVLYCICHNFCNAHVHSTCVLAGTSNVDAEFADICDAVTASKSVKHKTRLLFSKKHAPQLTAAILIPAFQQLNGINSITFYAPQLFSSIGAGFSGTYGALESSVVVDAIEMAGTLIGVATVDRYGCVYMHWSLSISIVHCPTKCAAQRTAVYN